VGEGRAHALLALLGGLAVALLGLSF